MTVGTLLRQVHFVEIPGRKWRLLSATTTSSEERLLDSLRTAMPVVKILLRQVRLPSPGPLLGISLATRESRTCMILLPTVIYPPASTSPASAASTSSTAARWREKSSKSVISTATRSDFLTTAPGG